LASKDGAPSSPPASPTVEGTVSQTTYTVALPFHDGSGFLASNDNNRIEPPGVFDQGSKELVVTPSQTATLYPGNYYFKKLIVSGVLNCRTSTGTVTIYIDGPVQVHSAGLVVNDTARPERLLLYKQASHPNNIQGEAPVHAYLEAPLGDVQVTGTFYGNIVAASLAVRSTATVHFDVQFAEVDKVGWEMASWSARPGD